MDMVSDGNDDPFGGHRSMMTAMMTFGRGRARRDPMGLLMERMRRLANSITSRHTLNF